MPSFSAHTVRFGKFQLDLRAAELHHNGTTTRLAEHPFQILVELVQHPGEVVTRDELRQRLWHSDTFVDFEQGLNTAVKRLREILGDSAEHPCYIETVPRHGYRLIVPVEEEQPVAVAGPTAGVRRWKIWLVASVIGVMVLALAAGLIWQRRSRRVYALTGSDTIVLADFSNSTGDPVFDDALKQALSVQLEQSPFLNIVSQARVHDTLRLMKRSADAHLTPDVGRDVCQRVGGKALVSGSIARLGSQYVVGLAATACSSGGLLAIEQEQAANKEDVLKALGRAASSLRRTLGESLGSIQKFDAPIEEVTTPSLEALKAYSLGVEANSRGDFPTASAFLQRAIALDPDFAMAYGRLAILYVNTGEVQRGAENMERAFELRERVSDRENLMLTAAYQRSLGDLEAERKACEMWEKMYPRDRIPCSCLGEIYSLLGDNEKALASFEESLRRDPSANDYGNVVEQYLNLNRLEEAKATAREAQTRHFDSPFMHYELYIVASVEHDAAGMERELDMLRKSDALFQRGAAEHERNTAFSVGQFQKARELTQRAVTIAEGAGAREAALWNQAWPALPEALVGNLVAARRQAKAALALSKIKPVEIRSAFVLGLAGDTSGADRLVSDLAQRYPQDTLMRAVTLPTIRAVIALQSGTDKTGEKAINALAPTAPYELAAPYFGAPPLFHLYIRGLAYIRANQPRSAAIEFQKILAHPGFVAGTIIDPLTRLQLARAHAMSGDTTRAKAAYQDFLSLWKDADPDIPILKEAKAEYEKLQ
jgi:DNA-binding winged helix-turn-helix (wHTH) protein/tetratricopeptide (TPR) repeat protein